MLLIALFLGVPITLALLALSLAILLVGKRLSKKQRVSDEKVGPTKENFSGKRSCFTVSKETNQKTADDFLIVHFKR